MLTLALLLLLASPPPPVLDGVVTGDEWRGARRQKVDGGELLLLRRGESLFVALVPAGKAIASLCIGTADRVRILHASAALGTAEYERRGEMWEKTREFDYVVRDSPRTGLPTEAQKREHLEKEKWLANPSHSGATAREFEIRVDASSSYVGFTLMNFEKEPARIGFWPPSMSDDCRALRLVQGWTDSPLKFQPEQWMKID